MLTKQEISLSNFVGEDIRRRYAVKFIGNFKEIKAFLKIHKVPILKVSKDTYKKVETWNFENGKYIPATFVKAKFDEPQDENGDRLYSVNTQSTRAADPRSVLRSLRKLEDIINCNITCNADIKRSLFVTLTYRYNVRDPEKVVSNFREFNRLVRQFLDKNQSPRHEYIAALEPQGRGAWHLHVIMLFPKVIPDILTQSRINKFWGHGMVEVEEMEIGSNIGKYFAAYLTHMDVKQAIQAGNPNDIRGKKLKYVDKGKQSKAIVKGARLKYYPAGINIYRLSRGIKKPSVLKHTADGKPLTFEDVRMLIPSDTPVEYDKAFAYSTGDGETINAVRYTRYHDDIPDYIRYDVEILNALWQQEMAEELERSRNEDWF